VLRDHFGPTAHSYAQLLLLPVKPRSLIPTSNSAGSRSADIDQLRDGESAHAYMGPLLLVNYYCIDEADFIIPSARFAQCLSVDWFCFSTSLPPAETAFRMFFPDEEKWYFGNVKKCRAPELFGTASSVTFAQAIQCHFDPWECLSVMWQHEAQFSHDSVITSEAAKSKLRIVLSSERVTRSRGDSRSAGVSHLEGTSDRNQVLPSETSSAPLEEPQSMLQLSPWEIQLESRDEQLLNDRQSPSLDLPFDAFLAATDREIADPSSAHFVAPVDQSTFVDYAYVVACPMDLQTIRTRLCGRYYRQTMALMHDVRTLALNAIAYNLPDAPIVTQAAMLVQRLLRAVAEIWSAHAFPAPVPPVQESEVASTPSSNTCSFIPADLLGNSYERSSVIVWNVPASVDPTVRERNSDAIDLAFVRPKDDALWRLPVIAPPRLLRCLRDGEASLRAVPVTVAELGLQSLFLDRDRIVVRIPRGILPGQTAQGDVDFESSFSVLLSDPVDPCIDPDIARPYLVQDASTVIMAEDGLPEVLVMRVPRHVLPAIITPPADEGERMHDAKRIRSNGDT